MEAHYKELRKQIQELNEQENRIKLRKQELSDTMILVKSDLKKELARHVTWDQVRAFMKDNHGSPFTDLKESHLEEYYQWFSGPYQGPNPQLHFNASGPQMMEMKNLAYGRYCLVNKLFNEI